MTIQPLHDRIFIKKQAAVVQTDGGILLPDMIKQEPMEGVVVAVGPGAYKKGERVEPVVKVGDRVLFGKWAIKDVEVDGEELATMKEGDIIGILKDK